jgi:hypothetical protein
LWRWLHRDRQNAVFELHERSHEFPHAGVVELDDRVAPVDIDDDARPESRVRHAIALPKLLHRQCLISDSRRQIARMTIYIQIF